MYILEVFQNFICLAILRISHYRMIKATWQHNANIQFDTVIPNPVSLGLLNRQNLSYCKSSGMFFTKCETNVSVL